MTAYEWLRLIVWLIGVPIIIFLVARIVQRVQAIRDLDARLREEESQNALNPYADMARMYEVRELLEKTKRGK